MRLLKPQRGHGGDRVGGAPQASEAAPDRRFSPFGGAPLGHADLLALQQGLGNRAVRRLLAGHTAAPPAPAPIRRKLTIGVDDTKQTYSTILEFNAVRALVKLKIRAYTPRVSVVMSKIESWVTSGNESFLTWEDAIKTALSEVRREEQLKAALHSPEAPPSPFHDSQEEEIDYLNDEGRKAEHMKEGRAWDELKIHGQLGEHGHQKKLKAEGTEFKDANNFLGYNAPGIDTLVNEAKPFGQSKMHLMENASTGEVAKEYEKHIDAAYGYAQTFLQTFLLDTDRGRKMREELSKLAKEWDNAVLKELANLAAPEKGWVASKGALAELLEPDSVGGAIQHVEPVAIVAKAMHFPVPVDVYDLIDPTKQGHFVKLPYPLDWYRKVKMGMKYQVKPAKGSSKKQREDDAEFNGDL